MTLGLQEQGLLLLQGNQETAQIVGRVRQAWKEYFSRDLADKLKDARPETGYATGLLPAGIEAPRDYSPNLEEWMQNDPMTTPLRPATREIKEAVKMWFDVKPCKTYPYLTFDPPSELVEWFGQKRLEEDVLPYTRMFTRLAFGLVSMLEYGLDLPEGTWLHPMKERANHLFYPTGVDLASHMPTLFDETKEFQAASIFGFHNDFSFLTLHGVASEPGLYVWNYKTKRRIPVRYPADHILVQSGRQLEWYSGGSIKASYHEVAVRQENLGIYRRHFQEQNNRLVRVALPWFAYMPMAQTMSPTAHLATPEAKAAYPPVRLGDALTQYLVQKFGFKPPVVEGAEEVVVPAGFSLPNTFKGHEAPTDLSHLQSASTEGYAIGKP